MAFSDWGGAAIGGATGLASTIIGSNAQSKANEAALEKARLDNETALQLAMIANDTAKIQANAALATAKNQPTSNNKTLYIALGIGGVVVLGVVIFAVTRKK